MAVHEESKRLLSKSYSGAYSDEYISVGALLENPRDYRIESSNVVFSVTFEAKKDDIPPSLEDFNFYIMDESNRLYNARIQPRPISDTEMLLENNDPTRRTNGLIVAALEYEFLFQSLRLAFYYKPAQDIHIIELKHN